MTDYEKDYNRWKNGQSFNGRCDPEPKRSDYDEYGFKANTVIYENNLILDKYLVNTYGIEYVRQNPIMKIIKKK